MSIEWAKETRIQHLLDILDRLKVIKYSRPFGGALTAEDVERAAKLARDSFGSPAELYVPGGMFENFGKLNGKK